MNLLCVLELRDFRETTTKKPRKNGNDLVSYIRILERPTQESGWPARPVTLFFIMRPHAGHLQEPTQRKALLRKVL